MLGNSVKRILKSIIFSFACIIIAAGYLMVFDIISSGQAKASTGPAPGWTTESATPLANTSMNQIVCLSTSNCFGIGETSNSFSPYSFYTSTDGGQTWNINPAVSIVGQNGGRQLQNIDEISCPTSTECYLNNNFEGSGYNTSPIYESTNSGSTWTNVSSISLNGYTVDSLSCTSVTTCIILATSGTNTPSILVTTNSGATWTSETVPSTLTSGYEFGPSSLSCNTGGVCLGVTAIIPGISTSSKVILSTDSGSTWTDITSSFGSSMIDGIYCSNFNTTECLAGTTGSVYISTNSGSSWTQTTSNLMSPYQITTAFCAGSSQCFVIASYGGQIFETLNQGSTWTDLTLPSQASNSIGEAGFCSNSNNCVVSGSTVNQSVETGFALVTTNGGSSFTYNLISPNGTPSFSAISCASGTTSCYALTSTGVEYSNNDGASWTNEAFPATFFGLGISCPSATVCYVSGSENALTGVLYTANSGTNWTFQAFSSGSFTAVSSMGLISCESTSSCVVANIGYLNSGSQQALYFTTNSGTTWNFGTPPASVNTTPMVEGITCVQASTDCIVIGQSGNYPNATYFVENTSNAGSTWSVLSSSTTTSLFSIDCPSTQICYGKQQTNGAQSLVISTNGGSSWSTLSSTLTANHLSCFSTTECTITTEVYTAQNSVYFEVYTTVDSGVNWYSTDVPQVQSENVSLSSSSFSCFLANECQFVGTTATQNVILGLNFSAPSAPASVSAVDGGTSVGVSWNVPSNIGGASPSSYTVSGNDTTTNTSITPITVTGNPPGTVATFSSLTEGDSYIFNVTATNIFGTGPAASSNSVTIPIIPTVTNLSPTTGTTAGGTPVTITGTNFTNTDAVDFGSTPAASVTYVSPTQLTAVSPPGTGSVGVTVISGSQISNSITFSFVLPSSNTVYTPVTPTRICDTRTYGSGAQVQTQCNSGSTSNNGPLSAGQILNINVQGTFGSVTVPSNATAVVLNVTVTGTTQPGGFLTLYPAGATRPNTSVINFGSNDTIANLVQVGVGQNGQVSIYNFNGSPDVIVDLEGYYAPASSTQGLFIPISPVRVCDTRSVANGSSIGSNQCNTGSNSTMSSNSTLTVNVSGSGPGGTADKIPSNATAVVANITATNTTQAGGFLTVYPTPSGSSGAPVASNLNFGPGISIANRVIVPIGANGDINIYNFNGTTDVIVDINGYFTGSGSSSGNSFNPIVPTRICDTRAASGTSIISNQCDNGTASSGALSQQGTISVQVSNLSSIPSNATAVVLNVTVTNTTSNGGFLTIYPKPSSGSSTPTNSDLNWSQGETIANQVVVEVGANDSINVFNSVGSTDLIIDVMGYYS